MNPLTLNAIVNLRHGCLVSMEGAEIVHYEHAQTLPTEAEIAAEIARIEAEAAATQYRRARAKDYPPIGDQLDALWKGGAEAEAMKATIAAVKAAHPKP